MDLLAVGFDKYQHPIIYALSSYHSRQGCKP
jgi:hypothetical protein